MNDVHEAGHDGDLPWDDPRLQVASDDARKAQYRLLQSWYREKCLEKPRHGRSKGKAGRCVGSMLHESDVESGDGLNLMPEARKYAPQRVQDVKTAGGNAEEHRLKHNMLSSMPMCFSIFGTLRGLPDRSVGVVRELFDPDAEEVEWIECEWKPESNPMKDNTAFDAAIAVRRTDGTRHLIGVETKYTETFSSTEYLTPTYVEVHKASGWFRKHSIVKCASAGSNQLWRSLLLAAAIEGTPEFERVSVAVLALADDPGAEKALGRLRKQLDPDNQERCSFVSLESLVAAARRDEVRGALAADWASRFEERYLDLSPVIGKDAGHPSASAG